MRNTGIDRRVTSSGGANRVERLAFVRSIASKFRLYWTTWS